MLSISAATPSEITVRAKRLRAFVILLMIALAGIVALSWLRPATIQLEMHVHANGMDPRVALTIVTLLLELALLELARMLNLVTRGECFSVQAIGHFRGFAFWLLLLGLIGLVAPMFELRSNGHLSVHFIRINLGALLIFLMTLVLFLIARLLKLAGEIEQENSEIV